ncbi:ArdC family protein [Mesorhizobium sp. M0895]|uniref:ArdC family protein n=1 Tax=Mesorhizobium sp. M0895 TaxID=2957019 RepID=UPI003336D0AC
MQTASVVPAQKLAQARAGAPASLCQEITYRIIAELERGTVPWVKPWGRAKAGLGLPRNASSGRQPPLLQQKNSSCRSMAEQGILSASRSSVLP